MHNNRRFIRHTRHPYLQTLYHLSDKHHWTAQSAAYSNAVAQFHSTLNELTSILRVQIQTGQPIGLRLWTQEVELLIQCHKIRQQLKRELRSFYWWHSICEKNGRRCILLLVMSWVVVKWGKILFHLTTFCVQFILLIIRQFIVWTIWNSMKILQLLVRCFCSF